jgi:hypothetical protein
MNARGRSSVVERQPSKLNVEGSNPFARFSANFPSRQSNGQAGLRPDAEFASVHPEFVGDELPRGVGGRRCYGRAASADVQPPGGDRRTLVMVMPRRIRAAALAACGLGGLAAGRYYWAARSAEPAGVAEASMAGPRGKPIRQPPNIGACCLAPDICVVATADECLENRGTFRGVGTLCQGSHCPP